MRRHWHAFVWTGQAYSDAKIRAGEAPAGYAPIEIADWLRKPPRYVVETFTGIDAAVSWLGEQLVAFPPRDIGYFPAADRLEHARTVLSLGSGSDVVWGYYSGERQYVSRALVACPRTRATPLGAEPPCCPAPPEQR